MNIKQLVFMISTLCMFYACEVEDRIIELEPHDSRLVLNAQIYQGDTSSSILLNQSFGITDTLSKDENIAVNKTGRISLFTPDEGVVEGYIYKEPLSQQLIRLPLWKFDYQDFIPGESYRIEAESECFDRVVSDVVVPHAAELVDVKVTLRENTSTDYFVRDKFEITISDPVDEENYYLIKATRVVDDNGFFYTRKFRFYDVPQNPIDESFIENRITVLNDKNFDGKDYKFTVYGERGPLPFSEIIFTIYQITKEDYDYQVAFNNQNNSNPFSEPVTFPNNIEKGYGVFSISSKPATKIIKI